MRKSDIIVARVSQGMGHFRPFWVIDETPDGWVCGVVKPGDSPQDSYWFSPGNIVYRAPAHTYYDYNNIPPGTLVTACEEPGTVIERKGSNYEVMISGKMKTVDWREVVPMAISCEDPSP